MFFPLIPQISADFFFCVNLRYLRENFLSCSKCLFPLIPRIFADFLLRKSFQSAGVFSYVFYANLRYLRETFIVQQ